MTFLGMVEEGDVRAPLLTRGFEHDHDAGC